jgi:23S rRNA (pseudouridine1915-N3)-methyltransferase
MGWRRCGARNWTRSRLPLSELLLVAVGKIGRGPEAELFARYAERIRPRLVVTEVAEGRGSALEIKRREADALLAAVPANAFVVALDLAGAAPSSEEFSKTLDRWLEAGKPVCFVIGGAEGFDAKVLERAGAKLSLGPQTWPHMLVRVMLAEQIFRARAISAGHPYHRAGRP